MQDSIFSEVLFQVGPVEITETVVTSWGVMVFLCLGGWIVTRGLSVWRPKGLQILLEAVVEAVEGAIEKTVNANPWPFVPLIGGMWLYIGAMNLVNLLPHLHNPTRDLSTTAALAAVSFTAVHYYGIRYNGLRNYLRHYLEPVFILAPFNLFGELSRTVAMAIRLFGNMLSWEMVVGILMLLAGLLVPVPLIILSIVGDLIQAYLFGALTLVFIAGAVQTIQKEGYIITDRENH